MQSSLFISSLSDHLFWDIDKAKLHAQKSKSTIIQRVLDYGLMADWFLIKEYYGLNEIVETAKTLRNLHPKSLSFIACITDTPLESFRCYTSTPLQSQHWHY